MKRSITDEDSNEWRVFDKDTGEEIKMVLEADDETGRYLQHIPPISGKAEHYSIEEITGANIEFRRVGFK